MVTGGGETFYHFDVYCVCSGPNRDPAINNYAFLSLCRPISQASKVKMRLCKGQHHPHDVDNAGKDGGRGQRHQDGQVDVRKALFSG